MHEFQEKISQVTKEMSKVVVGQEYMINRLLVGLFTDGHILLEGVPGLAKTLTVNTMAKSLALAFQRIQFTPDLLPSDLIGTMIYNQKEAAFEVKKGPIFSNIILADEVNRSPAKVQAALLEAMQEKQVTIGETTYPLDKPFLVMATQNPVEQEGTYPLPEAQVDRFMMKVFVSYPSVEDELKLMRLVSNTMSSQEVNAVLTKEDIFNIKQSVQEVSLEASLEQYIVDLIFATRYPKQYGLGDMEQYIQFGASPRASIFLHRGAKAMAFMNNRKYVIPEDIKEIALDILNHRILLNYEAQADNVSSKDIVDALLKKVKI